MDSFSLATCSFVSAFFTAIVLSSFSSDLEINGFSLTAETLFVTTCCFTAGSFLTVDFAGTATFGTDDVLLFFAAGTFLTMGFTTGAGFLAAAGFAALVTEATTAFLAAGFAAATAFFAGAFLGAGAAFLAGAGLAALLAVAAFFTTVVFLA
ncbi:hypothetical protein [Chitinophaga solisilvae]|uniref:hypothetical protein n=1 Tax=Chitinophaga solisilvae TaxID=1233460 RepID=UPI001F22B343|nr:hypothetical protein [Chitinophaga solisilvae]